MSEVLVGGLVDFNNADQVLTRLKKEVLSQSDTVVVLDLKAAVNSNSALVAVLLELIVQAKKSDKALNFISMPEKVMRMVEGYGLADVLLSTSSA